MQKQGTPIGTVDMLIAGHVRAENIILVTNNVREFARVPDLKIENWASKRTEYDCKNAQKAAAKITALKFKEDHL